MIAKDALRQAIRGKKVVVVAGCGVSAAATGNAPLSRWPDLLRSGVELVLRECRPGDGAWQRLVTQHIEAGSAGDLVIAATMIRVALGPKFGWWIDTTIGLLEPTHPDVPQALLDLDVPVSTTNFDTVIEKVGRLESVTWRNPADVRRTLRGEKRAVVHLHGVWSDAGSIVFDAKTYEDVLRDEVAQLFQQACAVTHSLMFVGVGMAARDPNVGRLLSWLADDVARGNNRHYWLCRDGEVDAVARNHAGVSPVAYGETYDDLAPFLRSLVDEVPRLAVAGPVADEPVAQPPTPNRPADDVPTWVTCDATAPWVAITTGDRLWLLTPEADIVCHTPDGTVRGPLKQFCEPPLRELAIVADGSYLVARDAGGIRVWTLSVDTSLTPWPVVFPIADDSVSMRAAYGAATDGGAVDVVLTGGGALCLRVDTAGRTQSLHRLDLSSEASNWADGAAGAAVTLRASLVQRDDGVTVHACRSDNHGTSERALRIAAQAPQRVVVARALRGRTAPYALVIEDGGRLLAWRWQDLREVPAVAAGGGG